MLGKLSDNYAATSKTQTTSVFFCVFGFIISLVEKNPKKKYRHSDQKKDKDRGHDLTLHLRPCLDLGGKCHFFLSLLLG